MASVYLSVSSVTPFLSSLFFCLSSRLSFQLLLNCLFYILICLFIYSTFSLSFLLPVCLSNLSVNVFQSIFLSCLSVSPSPALSSLLLPFNLFPWLSTPYLSLPLDTFLLSPSLAHSYFPSFPTQCLRVAASLPSLTQLYNAATHSHEPSRACHLLL